MSNVNEWDNLDTSGSSIFYICHVTLPRTRLRAETFTFTKLFCESKHFGVQARSSKQFKEKDVASWFFLESAFVSRFARKD